MSQGERKVELRGLDSDDEEEGEGGLGQQKPRILRREPAPASASVREPTITVDADLLVEEIGDGDPNATRIMMAPSVPQRAIPSAVLPRVSGPASGVLPKVVASSALPALTGDPLSGDAESTRIVSSLNLQELQDPRVRKLSQALPAVQDRAAPASGPAAPASPASMKAAAVPSQKLPAAPSQKLPAAPSQKAAAVPSTKMQAAVALAKKMPIALVKARSKVKAAPIDPQRLLVQQEAAERRLAEGTLHGVSAAAFERIGGEGGEAPAEATMIGRFLGLVGIGGAPAAAPVGKDARQETWELVEETPFLAGINPQYLREAVDSGDIKLLSLGRDMLIDPESRALLVRDGQVALSRFRPEVLAEERRAQKRYKSGDRKAEKQEYNRRQEVGPLIRLSSTNLALFQEGDLVGVEEVGQPDLALFSVTPVKVLSLSRARLEQWRRTYQFFGDRIRRAAEAARQRIDANSGARSLVADFFVRNGLSVAMTLRVRELDKCIECYACEKACEERYGVKRLSLGGKVLGGLDFVDSCRTCLDQRCIDPCAYDAIKFDNDIKEVVINEEACTGCTMCAVACPYDAIAMHELEERPLLKLRLEKGGKLEFGDTKPRKAQLRRIAQKCDHCSEYQDQACVSACPTGAILEMAPEAAFVERTESMAEAARGGFDQTAMVDVDQLFNPEKFIKGMEEEDQRGRVVEKRLNTAFLWWIGALGVLGCGAEIALRKLAPALSLQYLYYVRSEGLDADVALQNIDFRPGSPFALWLGYIGAVVMFSSTFYSANKWIPAVRRLGSQRAWFDFHVWAGTIGPLFVLMHSAAKLDNWVSFAVWSMIATTLSGLVGRYLSTELPDLANQASLYMLELDRQLGALRNRHGGVAEADSYLEQMRRRFGQVSDPRLSSLSGSLMALRLLLVDELSRPLRRLRLHQRFAAIRDHAARREAARLTAQLVVLERRRLLLPRIGPLFKEWKTIHIPFAILLSVLAGMHIVLELMR